MLILIFGFLLLLGAGFVVAVLSGIVKGLIEPVPGQEPKKNRRLDKNEKGDTHG